MLVSVVMLPPGRGRSLSPKMLYAGRGDKKDDESSRGPGPECLAGEQDGWRARGFDTLQLTASPIMTTKEPSCPCWRSAPVPCSCGSESHVILAGIRRAVPILPLRNLAAGA